MNKSHGIADILVNNDAILQENGASLRVVARVRSFLHEIPAFHHHVANLRNLAMSVRHAHNK